MSLKMLAFDFGASSGRAILGIFDGKKLDLTEIHRFSNDPVEVNGNLHWDVLRLFYEIKQGILKAGIQGYNDLDSIGVDTWGVDFGLLDRDGNLIGNPYHYRDKRTDGMMDEAFRIVPRDEIYRQTGIQFMWYNTLFQLLSMRINNSPQLQSTATLLFMPDLFNYFLTGTKSTEYSIASTSQLMNPVSGTWAYELMDRLGIPTGIFTDITKSGTIIGNLNPDIATELRVNRAPVVSVASHDTASAVAAVPASGEDYIYISSGTWSLLGVELSKPIINDKSLKFNFTNEGGVNNTVRFLKNIMGLWLIQECRRQWQREGENLSYSQLEQMAMEPKPFEMFIDPDHNTFAYPGDMPGRIREFCRNTSQAVPQTKSEIMRCIYQSLALKYRYAIECMEEILGRKLPVIHIVGGGIKDRLLSQLTADATGKHVIAGPAEATALGNIAVQAMALGEVGSLKEAREIIKNSVPTEEYIPKDGDAWDAAYDKFRKILDKAQHI